MGPKKSFNANIVEALNPALQFISMQNTEDQSDNGDHIDKGISHPVAATSPKTRPKKAYAAKQKILYPETKSKRVQLLFKPSLHAKLKKLATKRKTSLNDLVHTMLEEALQD